MLATTGLGACSKPESSVGGEPGSVLCPASVSPSVSKGLARCQLGQEKLLSVPSSFPAQWDTVDGVYHPTWVTHWCSPPITCRDTPNPSLVVGSGGVGLSF